MPSYVHHSDQLVADAISHAHYSIHSSNIYITIILHFTTEIT